jgi:hypothetical protein
MPCRVAGEFSSQPLDSFWVRAWPFVGPRAGSLTWSSVNYRLGEVTEECGMGEIANHRLGIPSLPARPGGLLTWDRIVGLKLVPRVRPMVKLGVNWWRTRATR